MERTQHQHYVSITYYKSLQQELQDCIDSRFLDSLADFQKSKQDLEHTLQKLGLQEDFHERLLNFQSIENGQIEGLYNLNQEVTETLIKQGFSKEFFSSRALPGQDAALICQQLQDHRKALSSLFISIKDKTPFSLKYIRDLHQQLCAHQVYTHGEDNLGNKGQIKLIKGAWKQQPNNQHQEDSKLFHYCPPDQVQAEMQILCDPLASLEQAPQTEHALLYAAWLHHRFSLIRPFQGGNGRTARLLASLWLICGDLYPLIIPRECYKQYLDSLKAADEGHLKKLLYFLLEMQNNTLEFGQDIYKPQEWRLKARQVIQGLKEQEFLIENWHNHPSLWQWIRKKLIPLIKETVKYTTEEVVSFQKIVSTSISYRYDPKSEKELAILGYVFVVSFNKSIDNKIVALLFLPKLKDDLPIYNVGFTQELSMYNKETLVLPDLEKLTYIGEFSLDQLKSGVADSVFRDMALQILIT